jgi:hypothetical protein
VRKDALILLTWQGGEQSVFDKSIVLLRWHYNPI